MLEGLRGEESIAALLPARRDRREPLLQLVEGVPGSRQEAACGDTAAAAATSDEVKQLRRQAGDLKEGQLPSRRWSCGFSKKSMIADGGRRG